MQAVKTFDEERMDMQTQLRANMKKEIKMKQFEIEMNNLKVSLQTQLDHESLPQKHLNCILDFKKYESTYT